MVHRGFLQTWTCNKFSERVLHRALEIIQGGKVPPEEFQVLMTGTKPQSLGNQGS